ncbi:hypothetical protein [Desulfosudis oleivorans]|uniref:Uncharacterized protein n=1 Tax=Desulfosudis oleivorans (strain DSM 6200 / JCM 39069 / Hxd3) TaxID=96561 RepID=A9A027_DESOH|nr:hypothetical protein [Desulfosudis oleivorans]ABW67427.1 hypothetical protein Dole_1623 [Desulfosudis oleivorans Hxd3]
MTVQVKGVFLIDLVKQVRAQKDKNWTDYLTADDMAIINSQVLLSSWYPEDFFFRLCMANFKVIGQSNLETCFAYGQLNAHNLAEVYKISMIVQNDPAETIQRLVTRRQAMFTTDYQGAEKITVVKEGNRATIHSFMDPQKQDAELADVIHHSLLGIVHELAVMVGGSNVRSEISRDGDVYKLTVMWD